MYIKRKIEDDILKYLDSPEIIAIVGPRQCGKTTTLKRIYQNLELLLLKDCQFKVFFKKHE